MTIPGFLKNVGGVVKQGILYTDDGYTIDIPAIDTHHRQRIPRPLSQSSGTCQKIIRPPNKTCLQLVVDGCCYLYGGVLQ